ncbi:MAG: B12-binding domain-containing radical SAM protein [Eubacteriaceae bacterium]|nr:B12-binding domain-containing radical SAM protein [Eubacteriaceae bacterium]
MKVLLIRPAAPNPLSFLKILDNEPLELEYLYTALKEAGHEGVIYDSLFEKTTVFRAIELEEPDIVAITGYITQESLMMDYARIAKAYNPKIATVIGGVHAQVNYQRFYGSNVDFVFRSESMEAFAALAACIESGNDEGLGAINGLCYRQNGVFVENPLLPISIDSLPIPDRAFFYGHKSEYRYLDLEGVATVKTAFSCPFNCNFCYCTLLGGGKYAPRSLDLVIEELKGLGAQNVQIVDDDFTVDKHRVLEFVRLVRENNINKTFVCYSRADFVAANPDVIEELAQIGFKYFLVGLEAATDADLASFNKGTSVDINQKCIEAINNSGAECIALMICPINATKEHFRHMYEWIVANKLKYVTVSIFTPIPGTALYEEYKDKLVTENVEDWDFLHLVVKPEKISAAEFYMEFYRLTMKLYQIAKKEGIYSFMDLVFYKNLLGNYLLRKARGKNL